MQEPLPPPPSPKTPSLPRRSPGSWRHAGTNNAYSAGNVQQTDIFLLFSTNSDAIAVSTLLKDFSPPGRRPDQPVHLIQHPRVHKRIPSTTTRSTHICDAAIAAACFSSMSGGISDIIALAIDDLRLQVNAIFSFTLTGVTCKSATLPSGASRC